MLRLVPRQRVTLLLAAAVTAASVAGCTGNHEQVGASSPPPSSPTTTTSRTPDVPSTARPTKLTKSDAELHVTIRQLRGGVPGTERARLRRVIAQPITDWVQAGFLDGPYPRNAFGAAFHSWTAQAAALGRGHRNVTTNAALGPRLVDVAADRQWARLFIFASHGKTGGANAKVYLRLTGQRRGGGLTTYTISGDLYLIRHAGVWRIFGYDLHRTVEER